MIYVGLFLTMFFSGASEPAHWTQLAPYPTNISNNAITSTNEQGRWTLYSFMGIVEPNKTDTITAASYKLSFGDKQWTRIADAPKLDGRAKIAASAITCAGKIYLFGGYTVSDVEVSEKRLFMYDPKKDQYIKKADVPVEVDDTVVGVYQDRYIYLISGWHGPIHANTKAVQVYDTQKDQWQQATPIPTGGRFGHAGGLVGNHLVLIDGASDERKKAKFPIIYSTFVGEIDEKDLTKIIWKEVAKNPYSQTYRAANSLGHCRLMLFAGGTDNPYNINGKGYNGIPSQPLDLVMAFNPKTSAWQRILTDKKRIPTMDHRGFARFAHYWVTVGGMTAPGVSCRDVNALTIKGICD